MSNATTRRSFLLAASALSMSALVPFTASASAKGKVVVVGGGFGGATVARAIKHHAPDVDVTLVEPKSHYVTCPFSNAYLGGLVPFSAITHDYSGLEIAGVTVINDRVVGMGDDGRSVHLKNGSPLPFDRLMVAPGISFADSTDGYDASVSQHAPHAWQAGDQTKLLRAQLEAMDDGGLFVMVPPSGKFRCPPGPYERVSLIANYFNKHKPKSRIMILDRKNKFSKQGLFQEGWASQFPTGMIEWVSEADGGLVNSIDAKALRVSTAGETVKADVLNFIPNQRAGAVAEALGLTDDSGWCPVDFMTFESLQADNVHVIGDAAAVTGMPKSGNAAHTQAQACAMAVVSLLKGDEPPAPTTSNTCYSLVTENYGISVTQVYRATDNGYVKASANSGGVSPTGAAKGFRKREADYARGWYQGITSRIWG